MSVVVKMIYEPAASQDGYRILVDRLWPRGIKKEKPVSIPGMVNGEWAMVNGP
jgi:uncharacterized protein YeaO (DUF488 family)